MLTQIPFLVRESARAWWHHRASTWPVLLTVFFASFLLMGCATLWVGLRWGSSPDSPLTEIRLFVKPEIPDPSLAPLALQIKQSHRLIESVQVVDRNAARREFLQRYGAEILAELDTNPLPASLVVRVTQEGAFGDSIARMVQHLETLPMAEGCTDPSSLLKSLEEKRLQLLVSISGVIAVVLLALWLILSNAVRLSLISRRVLVENLNMLGASLGFILLPFALESLGQTVFATGLGLTLAYGLTQVVSSYSGIQLPMNLLFWSWTLVLCFTVLISFAVTWWTLIGFLRKKGVE